jgi:integrase
MFVDQRFKRMKNRSTMMQEISVIKQFYTQYLIKKGYVFRIPEIPEFAKRQSGTSRREDTFNPIEYRKLYEYLRSWSNPKNVSNVRIADKKYGKVANKNKVMNEWEHQMEIHRRFLIRELILILANTGIRAPSEILSLKWSDIEVKKEKLALYSDQNTGEPVEEDQLVAYIKIGAENKTGARLVQGLAGRYFKRLNDYFRNKLDHIPQPNDPIFMEFYGRRKFNVLDRYALYRMWGELMRDCGLNRLDFQPYHLRHWYITQSILNGVDMLLIAKNCGNSINTIAKHYEHVDLKTQTKNLIKRRNITKEIENIVQL